ncbi:MAG TPA: amidohydrolase family protein [Blastocatellia bacterium]|nr:amidohydrolase family protein [Blastocatellia bacterium]
MNDSRPEGSTGSEGADTIYTNGVIITVNESQPSAEAVAIKGGKIVAVGARDDVMRYKGPSTEVVDLKGRTMIPGFVDGHSHICDYGMLWGYPTLNPPPVGGMKSIDDIIARMREFIEKKKIPRGVAVFGSGYDESMLAELRHPTKEDLDRVSTEHPVVIVHTSGHLGSANTMALEKVGFVTGAPNPKGGRIRCDPQTGEPTGVVEEQAVFNFFPLLPPTTETARLQALVEIQNYYASYGITTAQDGQTLIPSISLLKMAAARGKLIIDIVSYPKWTIFEKALASDHEFVVENARPGFASNIESFHHCGPPEGQVDPNIPLSVKEKIGVYHNRLKFGGVKITCDGSPQGETAFLTKPYFHPPEGQPADYRGYPILSQEEMDGWFAAAYERDVQVCAHCNGDAAADMMIEAVRKAQWKYGRKELRPVMVHAQTVRADQLDQMNELGIVPSFFSSHTFYWGDWYINEALGRERARHISPLRSALKRGMKFANHTDAPVTPPDQLMVIHSAVNRTSRSGVIVGPEERISPMDALKAVTIWGAYQYFEENEKGSIEPGKRADLAVLSDNPLTVDDATIKDIKVLQTIKDGKTIYDAAEKTRALIAEYAAPISRNK